jgi:hypothetical protein
MLCEQTENSQSELEGIMNIDASTSSHLRKALKALAQIGITTASHVLMQRNAPIQVSHLVFALF